MLKFFLTCCCHYFTKNYGLSKDTESVDLHREVDQRIHNPDSDSSHKTSESVDLTNLDSTDYGCEIRLVNTLYYIYIIVSPYIYLIFAASSVGDNTGFYTVSETINSSAL